MAGFLFWRYSDVLLGKDTPKGPVVLTVWGLDNDEAVMRPVIAEYQNTHPNVQIIYVKQSFLNYRTRVQTQIRASQGPDVFTVHSSWLPMFGGDLSSLPSSVVSSGDFNKIFYPVFKEALTLGGKIYALPTGFDGLAMYYNEDILKAAGVGVPKTWQEFVSAARQMTVKNQEGQIQTSGAALGGTSNIDFWPEIIAMFFLQQPATDLASPGSKASAEALLFYTGFITDPRNKTWDTNLPNSTQMFIDGKLAFYFAPSRQAQVIKSANLTLNFKTAPVPQLPGGNIALGSFWVETVSGRSTKQQEAWEFLKYLSSPAALQLINRQRVEMGFLARPYPRPDTAGLLASDPILGSFTTQASYSKAWYLNSGTQDVGINEDMIKIYGGAVNSVLQGQDAQVALQGVAGSIQEILVKYKVETR